MIGILSNQPKVLDITHLKLKGAALTQEIENMVGATQKLIIQPLPNELLMTQAQFEDLIKRTGKDFTEDEESNPQPKEQIYRTKHNCMDIRVRDENS